MRRKSLSLVAVGLFLFAALFAHMTAVQAATPGQTTPDAAVGEPQPLPQPIRIKFRQSIPFTISLASAPLLSPTAVLTPNATVTDTAVVVAEAADAVADTVADTEALTDTETLTDTAVAASESVTETVADTTEALTDTLTGTADAVDALTSTLTSTVAVTAPMVMTDVPVTLTIELDVVVTNTLTTTVPASATLELPGVTTMTLPVSVTLATQPDGELVVELLPLPPIVEPTEEATPEPTAEITATAELTTTPEITVTAEITATPEVAPTVPDTVNGLPVVNTTATVTANLRSGPATTFETVGQASPGQTIPIVAISEDGQWYLLNTGAWIAAFLTAEQPANLPIATQAIIDQLAGGVPAATPAATEVVAPPATPVPAAATPVTPTVTVDANLRAGPGTEFPVIGGTITGQALTIVGRNADGTWFRLDNTGWVFGELISNLPPLETIPVVNADGTPVAAPAPEPTPAPETTPAGGLFPTPTPLPAGAAAAPTGPNAAYLTAAQRIVGQYDDILVLLDALIAEARGNSAQLANVDWATRVNAAVALLRQTTATVGELSAPAELATVQQNLEAAAQQYTAAANALQQAASTAAVAQLDAADAAIELANASLTAAETGITQANQ
jgi:uncharacterized protein YraI